MALSTEPRPNCVAEIFEHTHTHMCTTQAPCGRSRKHLITAEHTLPPILRGAYSYAGSRPPSAPVECLPARDSKTAEWPKIVRNSQRKHALVERGHEGRGQVRTLAKSEWFMAHARSSRSAGGRLSMMALICVFHPHLHTRTPTKCPLRLVTMPTSSPQPQHLCTRHVIQQTLQEGARLPSPQTTPVPP